MFRIRCVGQSGMPSQFVMVLTSGRTADIRSPRSRIAASAAKTSAFSDVLKRFHPASLPYAKHRNFIFNSNVGRQQPHCD